GRRGAEGASVPDVLRDRGSRGSIVSMADPPRLLVVEDDRNLATGLKLNFELEGYAVDVVHSIRDAGAHLIESGKYEALILDVMLPDNDDGGFVLCQKLRDAGDFTPVLMLTARERTADRVRGLEAGADDYLDRK